MDNIIPEEFIGRESNLQVLYEFVNTNPNLFVDVNTSVIKYYYNDVIKSNKYYLGGDIPLSLNDRISQELLKSIDTKNENIDWNECSHHLERMSIISHVNSFDNLKKIIKIYYDHMIEELYRPPNEDDSNDKGGEVYVKIKETTMVGKFI